MALCNRLSTNRTRTCEGVLSNRLPVRISKSPDSPRTKRNEAKQSFHADLPLRKRTLYAGRELGSHSRSEYVLQDGSADVKKDVVLFLAHLETPFLFLLSIAQSSSNTYTICKLMAEQPATEWCAWGERGGKDSRAGEETV
jgi:hypothetical protein